MPSSLQSHFLLNQWHRLRQMLQQSLHRTAIPNSSSKYTGASYLLDGSSAVALAEASISEFAALGENYFSDSAVSTWQNSGEHSAQNFHHKPLATEQMGNIRGTLSASIGASMGGLRACAFLSGPEIINTQDLLKLASARHLPLVIHLRNQALTAHAATSGTDHEAFHYCSESGFFTLFASNVQEAVDFTFIARYIAEQTLLPGLLAVDNEQTALCLQDFELPSAASIKQYLGGAKDIISPPTAAQRILFGDQRRRVPRWHNLDQPIMQGSIQSPEQWSLGAIGHQLYFAEHLHAVCEQAFSRYAEISGRHYAAFSSYQMDNAELVLLAQGSAVETAELVADYLANTKNGLKVGVVGLKNLRPFPKTALAKILQENKTIAVLERHSSAPLIRELRAALHQSEQQANQLDNHRCKIRSIIYGLGGAALKAQDLIALCRSLPGDQSRYYLGSRSETLDTANPKQQALIDQLQREYPQHSLMMSAAPDIDAALTTPLSTHDSINIALHQSATSQQQGLAGELAHLIHELMGGHIRSRCISSSAQQTTHQLICSQQPLKDPGDNLIADLVIINCNAEQLTQLSLATLPKNTTILLSGDAAQDKALTQLPTETIEQAQNGELVVYRLTQYNNKDLLNLEIICGALVGLLLTTKRLEQSTRAICRKRASHYHHTSDEDSDPYKKRETFTALLEDAFKTGIDSIEKVPVSKLSSMQIPIQRSTPAAVEYLAKTQDDYSNLPRFWDNIGEAMALGNNTQVFAGPFMALGALPPRSAAMRHPAATHQLPCINSAECTGCGLCWTRCPNGSIGARSFKTRTFIDSAIRHSKCKQLTPIAAKLASTVNTGIENNTDPLTSTHALFQQALTTLLNKLSLPDEREILIKQDFQKLLLFLKKIPTIRTELFFDGQQRESKGNAQLLALAIDPASCNNCGICVSACNSQAITLENTSPNRLQQYRDTYQAWQTLPNKDSSALQHLAAPENIGPLATKLLSNAAQQALSLSDLAEPGSGESIALRLSIALFADYQTALYKTHLEKLGDLADRLPALLRKQFSAGVADDFDLLCEKLAGENYPDQSRADQNAINHMVKLSQDFKVHYEKITERSQSRYGPRCSVVLAKGAITQWAGRFPDNPFSMPVLVDTTGDAIAIARGLLESQIQQFITELSLSEQVAAMLEIGDTNHAPPSLSPTTWQQLNEEQKRLCPPVLLIANEESFAADKFADLISLMQSDLPIKILLFTELGLGLNMDIANNTQSVNLALLTLMQTKALVAQTAFSKDQHFCKVFEDAFTFSGPALLRVHTPSPTRHGFATDKTFGRTKAAVDARVLPLFYRPGNMEGIFNSGIEIDDNSHADQLWSNNTTGDATTPATTPAHWAFGEQRFRKHFFILDKLTDNSLELADYLQLSEAEQSSHTAIITVKIEANPHQFQLSPALVAASKVTQKFWQILQEISGLKSSLNDLTINDLESRLVNEKHSALEEQQTDFDKQLKQQQQQNEEKFVKEMEQRITSRLMELTGYVEPKDHVQQ